MISNCTNPECHAEFHYLRGGKLYRFDIRRPEHPCADVPNAICATRPSHASVYFWLCADCCRKFSLRFSAHEGLSVIPTPILSPDSRVVLRDADSD